MILLCMSVKDMAYASVIIIIMINIIKVLYVLYFLRRFTIYNDVGVPIIISKANRRRQY